MLFKVPNIPRPDAGQDRAGGAGQRRQDHHPVQAEAGRGGHHHPHHRLQRGERRLQEHQHDGLGRRGPDQDPAALAALLREHGRRHLRGGQRRF